MGMCQGTWGRVAWCVPGVGINDSIEVVWVCCSGHGCSCRHAPSEGFLLAYLNAFVWVSCQKEHDVITASQSDVGSNI